MVFLSITDDEENPGTFKMTISCVSTICSFLFSVQVFPTLSLPSCPEHQPAMQKPQFRELDFNVADFCNVLERQKGEGRMIDNHSLILQDFIYKEGAFMSE